MDSADQEFWNAYEALSKEGRCDSPGGMEYKRVFKEWTDQGRPANIEHFIKIRANMLSDGSTPLANLN